MSRNAAEKAVLYATVTVAVGLSVPRSGLPIAVLLIVLFALNEALRSGRRRKAARRRHG